MSQPIDTAPAKPLGPRHYLLGAALALTLAATMWAAQSADDEGDDAAQPVAAERRAPPGRAAAAPRPAEAAKAIADWNLAPRHDWSAATPAQLAAWAPPPPPPAPPAPPVPRPAAAAPVAPAFPYQLIGRMDETQADGKPVAVAFLSGPLRSIGVRAGELVDGQWRVDQIGPNGLTLTWLPQQLKQTIAFRPASAS